MELLRDASAAGPSGQEEIPAELEGELERLETVEMPETAFACLNFLNGLNQLTEPSESRRDPLLTVPDEGLRRLALRLLAEETTALRLCLEGSLASVNEALPRVEEAAVLFGEISDRADAIARGQTSPRRIPRRSKLPARVLTKVPSDGAGGRFAHDGYYTFDEAADYLSSNQMFSDTLQDWRGLLADSGFIQAYWRTWEDPEDPDFITASVDVFQFPDAAGAEAIQAAFARVLSGELSQENLVFHLFEVPKIPGAAAVAGIFVEPETQEEAGSIHLVAFAKGRLVFFIIQNSVPVSSDRQAARLAVHQYLRA